MARRHLSAYDGAKLVEYVEEQLGPPNYRTLYNISADFIAANGGNVSMTYLQQKLANAIPGVIIEYKATGILLRHPKIEGVPLEENE